MRISDWSSDVCSSDLPCAPVDLLVCSDVLHYLPARELDRGLPGLAELCGGVAFLETFGREDQAEGDEPDFKQRPASFYRRLFEAAGLRMLGSPVWLSPAMAGVALPLEGGVLAGAGRVGSAWVEHGRACCRDSRNV